MKRFFFSLAIVIGFASQASAQDDMYFTKKKLQEQNTATSTPTRSTRYATIERDVDVDEYNHRTLRSYVEKLSGDSSRISDIVMLDSMNAPDFANTRNLARFDSIPTKVNHLFVGSTAWNTPWSSWNTFTYYNPWIYGYYGYLDPWYYGGIDPYGPYNPWYYGYYPGGWRYNTWFGPHYWGYGPGWYVPHYYVRYSGPTGTRRHSTASHASSSYRRNTAGVYNRGTSSGTRGGYVPSNTSSSNYNFTGSRSTSSGSYSGGSYSGGGSRGGGSYSGGGGGGGRSGGGHFGGGRR